MTLLALQPPPSPVPCPPAPPRPLPNPPMGPPHVLRIGRPPRLPRRLRVVRVLRQGGRYLVAYALIGWACWWMADVHLLLPGLLIAAMVANPWRPKKTWRPRGVDAAYAVSRGPGASTNSAPSRLPRKTVRSDAAAVLRGSARRGLLSPAHAATIASSPAMTVAAGAVHVDDCTPGVMAGTAPPGG